MKQTEQLHRTAKNLLANKNVDIIVGYEKTADDCRTPCFVEDEKEVSKLVWDNQCVYNLAGYLIPLFSEYKKNKVGIVAKGCDVKAIVGLIQEHQIKRENVFIIAMECYGQRENSQKDYFSKCKNCTAHLPAVSDELIKGWEYEKPVFPHSENGTVALSKKTMEERWAFWSSHFEKCIRCYACREVCPLCYCKECIVDCNMPQWCSPVPSLAGNTTWNIIRAFHLAGRCVECGECERVCPVNIPLMLLNKTLADEVQNQFQYTAGQSWEVPLPLNDFRKEDKAEFIR